MHQKFSSAKFNLNMMAPHHVETSIPRTYIRVSPADLKNFGSNSSFKAVNSVNGCDVQRINITEFGATSDNYFVDPHSTIMQLGNGMGM